MIFGLCNHSVFSQHASVNYDSLKAQIQKVPIVFKGDVIDVQFFLGDKNGNRLPEGTYYLPNGDLGIGYSSAKILICQVLKSDIKIKKGTTVEIITSSPEHMQPYLAKDDQGKTVVGWFKGNFCSDCDMPPFIESKFSGIFFCNYAKYTGVSGFQFDNPKGLYPSAFATIFINSNWSDGNIYAKVGRVKQTFYSPPDFNEFLKKLSLDITAADYCFPTKNIQNQKNDSTNTTKQTCGEKIQYEKNLKNYNKYIEQMIKIHNIDTNKTFDQWKKEQQNLNLQKKSNDPKSIDLNLDIANPTLTGTDSTNKWFDFDIMASANSSVYFSSCLIRIAYNTAAFGSNVVANNNIVITRGSAFNIPTYTDPQTDKIDETSSVIGVPFGDDFAQPFFNRTLLSSFPDVLIHVSIRIKNTGCNNNVNIEFTDVSFTPMFSYYTLNPGDSIINGINFDNTNYSTGIYDKTCIPVITNFNNNVAAGIGSLITIDGKYFGQRKSVGTVIFRDANQGNVYPYDSLGTIIGIDDYDTVSWSDNQIVIRLPSILDNTASNQHSPVPGSGKFRVKNLTGRVAETTSDLIIPYALFQGVDNWPLYQKVNVNLADINDSGGYSIRCNTSMLSTWPNAKSVINRAMEDWVCATLVNWRLGADTTAVYSNDGVSVIFAQNLSGTALMSTYLEIKVCTTSPKKFYLRSFDIVINKNGINWQVDTSGAIASGYYDFYHAIAHELGHGVLLFHANQLGQIMYYQETPGPHPANQRVLVWNSLGAMDGGYYETDNLSSGIIACSNGHTIISAPQNCTGMSVHESDIKNSDIFCYPNPVETGNINLQINLKKNTSVYYKLYNSIGQIVRTSPQQQYNGQVTLTIPVNDLKSGFYFMQVYLNNRFKTVKWIKL